MRDFGAPIDEATYREIVTLAQGLFDRTEPKRAVRASDFAMDEEPDRVVVHEIDLKSEGQRLRIAATEANARPPFEWLLEITSDIGESDYFKHYLVRESDIVLAQRKILTPLDAEEAQLVIADLKEAASWPAA